jgi:hypothetical protein
MKHLTEEELIEHHYGEGKAEIKHHLEVCGECAEAYSALGHDLAELKAPEPPARAALYGEQVWRSLSTSLPAYALSRRSWSRVNVWKGVRYATACTLLVAVAFVAGRHWEQRKPPITAARNDSVKEHVVLVVLGDHLDRSERLLIELKHADPSSAATVSPLREEARSLLPANRRCRQSAIQIDDPALATVLDHLDLVLAELANEPGGWSASSINRLQTEMNTDNLLFEIRVLRSRVLDREPGKVIPSNRGTL